MGLPAERHRLGMVQLYTAIAESSCGPGGFQRLNHVARQEREFIRQRRAEGIAAAKKKGIRFGWKRMPFPGEFEALVRR